jgi:hypothetical protein
VTLRVSSYFRADLDVTCVRGGVGYLFSG